MPPLAKPGRLFQPRSTAVSSFLVGSFFDAGFVVLSGDALLSAGFFSYELCIGIRADT